MTLLRLATYLFTNVALLLIAFFVYFNNRKSTSNRVFAQFLVSISFWITSLAIADTSTQIEVVRIASKAAFASASILFFMLVWLAFVFPYENKSFSTKTFVGLLLPTSFFVLVSPTNLAVQSVAIKDFGAEVVSGPLYNAFFIYAFVYLTLAVVLFLRSYRKATGNARLQLRFLLYGLVISATIGIFTNLVLVSFGVSSLGFLGAPGVLILASMTAYSIVRHKLFDIRAVVARALTYFLVIATISVVYGLTAFVLVGGYIFKDAQLSFAQQTFYALLAVLLAFTFQPIRRFFQKITDKIFYRDKYDAQELINSVGRILTAEIRLSVLTKEVTKVIEDQMRVNKVDIVVVNDKNIYYQARVLRKDSSELELKDLQELGKPLLVADDMTSGDRKDIMDKYGLRVSITLRTSEEFVGYLLLGEKLSGDIYNEQDLAVLRIIANELAVAVQNAKAYTEIQQFNKTLQAKVVAATRKLRKANEDLKELDQAKDEFISMASHQLRTPLTTAKGYVSMILEGDFGKIQPAMKEPLEQALDSSNRMAGLVSDLLNVSRMEAGRFFIDPTDVDLNSEVPAEVVQLKTLAESKSVKLIYDKPAKPVPMMKLDLDKTRQVIMNLADNAVHYSAPPNGGGVVHVSLAHEGQDVVFKVVDNGIGVPEAQQKKLFKKFFRAGNAQNTRPDGTGLGLYLVKRVVEDQGGELIFESKEGKGSTFGFRMPVKNKIKPNSKASEKLNKAQYSPVPGAIQPTQDEKDTAAKEQEAADEEAAAKKAKK